MRKRKIQSMFRRATETQASLAEKIGIKPSTLCRALRGDFKLCDAHIDIAIRNLVTTNTSAQDVRDIFTFKAKYSAEDHIVVVDQIQYAIGLYDNLKEGLALTDSELTAFYTAAMHDELSLTLLEKLIAVYNVSLENWTINLNCARFRHTYALLVLVLEALDTDKEHPTLTLYAGKMCITNTTTAQLSTLLSLSQSQADLMYKVYGVCWYVENGDVIIYFEKEKTEEETKNEN